MKGCAEGKPHQLAAWGETGRPSIRLPGGSHELEALWPCGGSLRRQAVGAHYNERVAALRSQQDGSESLLKGGRGSEMSTLSASDNQ